MGGDFLEGVDLEQQWRKDVDAVSDRGVVQNSEGFAGIDNQMADIRVGYIADLHCSCKNPAVAGSA